MYSEDDLLPISALQHLLFCPRQCALIHVEGLWAENRLTVEGRHLHDKAHDGPDETRDGARIVRSLGLRSLQLGLSGKADVVEFRLADPALSVQARQGQAGATAWQAFPVEYKRGKPKANDCDRIQLCAQAMCLEEMTQTPVPRGALFYGKTRRRLEVEFTDELRTTVADTARRLHELVRTGRTPAVEQKPKCRQCSLLNVCLPQATGPSRSVKRFLECNLGGLPSPPDEDPEP